MQLRVNQTKNKQENPCNENKKIKEQKPGGTIALLFVGETLAIRARKAQIFY